MNPHKSAQTEEQARAEITRILYLYCRGVDRGDIELLREVFHEDAAIDLGIWRGLGRDYPGWIVAGLANTRSSHMVTNVVADIEGDDAWSESYCLATAVSAEATAGEPCSITLVNSRNIDRFERRNGKWKIADRRVVFEIARQDSTSVHADMGAGASWGRRDRQDPVYRP